MDTVVYIKREHGGTKARSAPPKQSAGWPARERTGRFEEGSQGGGDADRGPRQGRKAVRQDCLHLTLTRSCWRETSKGELVSRESSAAGAVGYAVVQPESGSFVRPQGRVGEAGIGEARERRG